MVHRTIKMIVLALLTAGLFPSCYYDNEEELYGELPCDTLNNTYSGAIAKLMADNCNACHGGSNPEAGILTDNYADLQALAQSGKLAGAVNHQGGFSPMPKGARKLSVCDLQRINLWIDNGTPQ
ncbi:MAG TPA: hypothetical protein P5248_03325 [Bacteroidales bacterium]|nr:hypothetical protein [Bacteroidales bacterium]